MGDPYAATPTAVTDTEPRCSECGRMLAWLVTRPWRIKCSRCGHDNTPD